jgi:hypothetical protein
MPVTPNKGYPYPALTDSPNGPVQIAALANAVDTADAAQDSAILVIRGTVRSGAATTSPTVTAIADVTGCVLTFTTAQANVQCVITGVFDYTNTAAGFTNTFVGSCMVDGVALTPTCNCSQNGRTMLSQTWTAVLAAPGSHTIKLRATTTSGTTITYAAGNTTITVTQLGL